MSNNIYNEGAVHNDYHQETNIQINGNVSTEIINNLAANFLGKDEKTEETKQSKKKSAQVFNPDCCFVYENKEYFAIAIEELTNLLIKHGLIPQNTDLKLMEGLFCGKPCKTKFTWLKDNHVLTHIIKRWAGGEHPILTTWPEGTSKWKVISNRFINEDGNPLPDISHEKARKKQKGLYDEIYNVLASYKRNM